MRLPWVRCQRQTPSEASVLQEARAAWAAVLPPPASEQHAQQAEPARGRTHEPVDTAGSAIADNHERKSDTCEMGGDRKAGAAIPPPPPGAVSSAGTGPLLLFPDTSAMLAMLGAEQPSSATPLTLHLLEVPRSRTPDGVKGVWTTHLLLLSLIAARKH